MFTTIAGDEVKCDIVRNGKPLTVGFSSCSAPQLLNDDHVTTIMSERRCVVGPRQSLVPMNLYERSPSYFIYAGAVRPSRVDVQSEIRIVRAGVRGAVAAVPESPVRLGVSC